MSVKITYYFSDIFPTLDNFVSCIEEYGIDISDPVFNQFVYNVINLSYLKANIRYNEKEAFMAGLVNVLMNKYAKFKKEKELINSIYKLTLDEINVINDALTNQSENPNTSPTNPLEPLNYVSSQTFQRISNNRLNAYLNAINNLPSFNTFEFLKGGKNEYKWELQINDLFMQVLPNNIYLYNKEEE